MPDRSPADSLFYETFGFDMFCSPLVARVKLLLCFYSLLAARDSFPSHTRFQYVNVLFQVVLGRFELPTSTLSV